MAKSKGFPWMSLILTIFCAFCWYSAYSHWITLYPTLQLLISAQQGQSVEGMATLATLNLNAFFVTIIWFVIFLAAAVIDTILMIVGWCRHW